MKRVVHLTTVHPRYDPRIFLKECVSLAKVGYSATLLVADGRGDEMRKGVRIVDTGFRGSRFRRLFVQSIKIYKAALDIKADIYHFHDPELLWVGWMLSKRGRRVIYDSHEDLSKMMMAKFYIPKPLRHLLSATLGRVEDFFSKKLSGVITPVPAISRRFSALGPKVCELRNYPMLDEFPEPDFSKKRSGVCYVGAVALSRGASEMVRMLEYLDCTLDLAGPFRPASLEEELSALPAWSRVRSYGFVDRKKVLEITSNAVAGLVILHSLRSYMEAIPVKMFEYMAAGLPVVASDFPFWRELLDGIDCAIFVNPQKPDESAVAVESLLSDPERWERMGIAGRRAVEERFCWEREEEKLMRFYREILE